MTSLPNISLTLFVYLLKYSKLAAAVFSISFLLAVSASATTFLVNSTADIQDAAPGDGVCATGSGNGICTLRAAITEANALAGDDIITLPAGTYTSSLPGFSENLNAGGDFDITSSITINGAGPDNTFVQAASGSGIAQDRVFHFVSTVSTTSSVNGVTIRYGNTPVNAGAGMRIEGPSNVNLNNVIVRDNSSATRGAGINVINPTSTLTMTNSSILNNMSGGSTSSPQLGGAAIFMTAGNVSLTNCTLGGNHSINNSTNPSTVSVYGGAINISGGTFNLTDSRVDGNVALSFKDSSAFGGGIYQTGSSSIVNITGSSITNNTAGAVMPGRTGNGGGLDNEQGALNLTNSTVSGNYAFFGAGVLSMSTGAAATRIERSAIVNNIASVEGGGVVNAAIGGGPVTTEIYNSTVGGNTSTGSAGGTEVVATGTGNSSITLYYATVAGNTANSDNSGAADTGGGVANLGNPAGQSGTASIGLISSVIGNNSIGSGAVNSPDVSGTLISFGYNHIENTIGGTFTPSTGDITGIDPGLGALALNGGSTLNYQPLPGSPILDTIPAGTNRCGSAIPIDQRNLTRPADSNGDSVAACEKGSIELQAPLASTVTISGRILTSEARGARNALVTLTDQSTNAITTAVSGPLGNYLFSNVATGRTYVLTVASRRFQYSPRTLTNVSAELTGIDIAPGPNRGIQDGRPMELIAPALKH